VDPFKVTSSVSLQEDAGEGEDGLVGLAVRTIGISDYLYDNAFVEAFLYEKKNG